MADLEHDSFEEYIEWLGEVRPQHVERAKKLMRNIERRLERGEGVNGAWWSSEIDNAIWGDLTYLARHDHTIGLMAHLVKKQQRTIERRRDTIEAQKRWGNQTPRDSQRSKLYAAEDVIRKDGIQFDDLAAIEAYVSKLTSSAWFQRRSTVGKVKLQRCRSGGWARGTTTIAISKRMQNEAVVLHELAHLMVTAQYGEHGVAWHGREFAKTFLELVRHQMGDESWRKLKASFVEHKVKHSLPRKPMTDEQRAAAAERLAQVRAA